MSSTESFLSASPVLQGLGMLRLDPARPEHRETVRLALHAGVETVDLGSVTADPASAIAKMELLVQATLTVPSFVPGSVRVLVRGDLGEAGRALDRLATLVSLSPDADTLFDWVYLVADPEFALGDRAFVRVEDPQALYARLGEELDFLESAVASGAISGYGVASAAFAYAKEDPHFLALEPLVRPEAPARARTGFGYVEFPFNLYESGAFLAQNQLVGTPDGGSETVTLLEAAERFGLHTIARRPLDAVTETQLLRLVAYPDHHRLDLDAAVAGTLEAALRFESEFAAAIPTKWAHRLRTNLRHVRDPEQWKEIRRRKLDPDLRALRESPAAPAKYLEAMDALLLAVQLWCEKFGAERNERIRARLVAAAPALRPTRDLATLLFRVYRATPGLRTVLVGTRTPAQFSAVASAFAGEPALGATEVAAVFAAGVRAVAGAAQESQEAAPETAAAAENAIPTASARASHLLSVKGPSA